MSVGEALAQARRRAGLTVSDVSEKTRIRETIIKDIERDDYSACGGDFYARGHIRALARAAGADSAPLIEEYDATQRLPSPDPVGEAAGSFPAIRPQGGNVRQHTEPLSEIRVIGQDSPGDEAAPSSYEASSGYGEPSSYNEPSSYGSPASPETADWHQDYAAGEPGSGLDPAGPVAGERYDAPGSGAGFWEPAETTRGGYPASGYDSGGYPADPADETGLAYPDAYEGAAPSHDPGGYAAPQAPDGGYQADEPTAHYPAGGYEPAEAGGYETDHAAAGYPGGGYASGDTAPGYPGGYAPGEPAAGYAEGDYAADEVAPGYPGSDYPAGHWVPEAGDTTSYAAGGYDAGGWVPDEAAESGEDSRWTPPPPAGGLAPGETASAGEMAGSWGWSEVGAAGEAAVEDPDGWESGAPPAPRPAEPPQHSTALDELMGGGQEPAPERVARRQGRRPARPPQSDRPEQSPRSQRHPRSERPPRSERAPRSDNATRPGRAADWAGAAGPGRAARSGHSASPRRTPGLAGPAGPVGPAGPAGPTDAQHRKRRGIALLSLVLLVIIGVVIYLVSSGSGAPKRTASAGASSHPKASTHPSSAPTTPASTPPTTPATTAPPSVLHPASVTAFGPGGAGQGDNQDKASLVIGHSSGTGWATDWYNSSHFGNLQAGTGLLLDMGHTVTITSALITLGSVPGADLELRVGSSPVLSALHTVATANNAGGRVRLSLSTPASARYVLVWFTALPPDSAGTYQARVYHIKLQ